MRQKLTRRFFQTGTPSVLEGGRYTTSGIYKVAREELTPVSLKQIHDFGKNPTENTFKHNCLFLQNEIPIRLAKMVVDLDNLPYNLSSAPNIEKIKSLHIAAFKDIRTSRAPTNLEEVMQFTKVLKFILHSHNFVVPHIACALYESSFQTELLSSCPFLNQFLSRYLTRRISIRMLMAQQCSLLAQYMNPEAKNVGFVGEIEINCEPANVINIAYEKAAILCRNTYGSAPPLILKDVMKRNSFRYIRGHLQLMCFELLKNAMRAICEFKGNPEEHPIKVIISDGDNDVVIKICDEGGGIPRKDTEKIWNFAFTTGEADHEKVSRFLKDFQADDRPIGLSLQQLNAIFSNSLCGLGYGLPTSRLYARYFHGDLQLYSVDGHGTDAFLYLNVLNHKTPYLF